MQKKRRIPLREIRRCVSDASLVFLPIVVGVVVVPITSCDHFLMVYPMVPGRSLVVFPVVPRSFLIVFLVVPLSLFFPHARSMFGTRFAFDAGMTFDMCLPRRCIGIGHRIEDRAARGAQTGLVGCHASRYPRDVGDFIRAQTKGVRLAGFTLLLGHFEGVRRETRAEAKDGRQHDESRSISNSTAFHDNSPQASRSLPGEPII